VQHPGPLTHGKPSYAPTVLNLVPVSACLEKSNMQSLPASQFQSCLHKPANTKGEQHATPLPTPLPHEHNPVKPLYRLNPHPPTKLKNINSKLYSNTNNGGGVKCWMLTCLREQEWGKEPKFEWTKGQVTETESRRRAINQPPKVGPWWIPELVSFNWGQYSKLKCPILLREFADQSCSCRATQLLPGNNNRSDHLHKLAVSYLRSQ
jgi:hypothetical protein